MTALTFRPVHLPAAALCLLLSMPLFPAGPAVAAPFTPAGDAEVLERLPLRRSDPASIELQALRKAHAAAPKDAEAAARLARRYFELAGEEGDPRYIGYAEAALRAWPGADAPVEVVLVRALLRQFRHAFGPALEDLAHVLARDPSNTEAMFWRAALHLAGARYDEARAECARLEPHATALTVQACRTAADSITGRARAAHDALARQLASTPPRDVEFARWVTTRLAEAAQRAGDDAQAERHYKSALAQARARKTTDGYLLAAYADLLLDLDRPAEVLALLREAGRSDVLLLRLAIAEARTGAPGAARSAAELRDRFAASALRGERLHQQEEARFALELGRDPKAALALAQENWKTQREPRDARVLMQAALAAGQPQAAAEALAWMQRTGYEEPRYRALAARLQGTGAAGQ